MLRDVLQNIMSLKIADRLKEVLITNTLQGNQELDREGCVTTLDLGVRFVFPYILTNVWFLLVRNLL
jgi:hypothetical protein